MVILLWAFIGILILTVLLLGIKIYLLQKATREINAQFAEKLITDTNTLIHISCHDRHMRKLAADINAQLRQLRKQRLRFQQGNLELMNAITNISHDLRTPLTAICGYLDLLGQSDCPPEARRYLAVIEERTDALKLLTEELFRYFAATSAIDEASYGNYGKPSDDRPPYDAGSYGAGSYGVGSYSASSYNTYSYDTYSYDAYSYAEININGVLEETLSAYYAALKGSKITPHILMPEKKIIRYLNKIALSRIFGNIISNAIKYSDGDLDIVLSENGEILFSNHASHLNELQVMQLFHRYYTVESAQKSTGLGLSIAKELTEKMNGEIAASYLEGVLCISVRF